MYESDVPGYRLGISPDFLSVFVLQKLNIFLHCLSYMHIKPGLGTEEGTAIQSISERTAEKIVDPREMKNTKKKNNILKDTFHLYTWYCYICQ
jgi:hypothetical protein